MTPCMPVAAGAAGQTALTRDNWAATGKELK
jgi:hypothetical protein